MVDFNKTNRNEEITYGGYRMIRMKAVEEHFTHMVGSAVNGTKAFKGLCELPPEQWEELYFLAERHKVVPLIFDKIPSEQYSSIPKHILSQMQEISVAQMYDYYKRVDFTGKLLTYMEEIKVQGVVLKGIGLCALYEKEELRKTNDVDLYLWKPEEFKRMCDSLQQKGFLTADNKALHHKNFIVPAGSHLEGLEVEVHSHIVGTFYDETMDAAIEQIFLSLEDKIEAEAAMGMSVPVLLPTENALYQLLHMLKHFIYKGFGVRQLCDWMVFLAKKKDQIDDAKLFDYLKLLKLEEFAVLITRLCVQFFDFPAELCPWLTEEKGEDSLQIELMQDILNGGDLGKYDKERMRCMTVKEKKGISLYMAEIHAQMKARFKSACNYFILWPFLWSATIFIFLYERLFQRKSSITSVLHSYHKRNRLYEKLNIGKQEDGMGQHEGKN